MMKIATLIRTSLSMVSLAMLAGCVSSAPTTLSDGTSAMRIACDGTGRGLNYCFERAGKSCGADGYTIVDGSGQIIGKSDVADADSDRLVRQYAEDQSSILVRCGG